MALKTVDQLKKDIKTIGTKAANLRVLVQECAVQTVGHCRVHAVIVGHHMELTWRV